MTLYHLRYNPAKERRFPHLRYPARGGVTRERAEHMRDAMPDPERFEIVEEDE